MFARRLLPVLGVLARRHGLSIVGSPQNPSRLQGHVSQAQHPESFLATRGNASDNTTNFMLLGDVLRDDHEPFKMNLSSSSLHFSTVYECLKELPICWQQLWSLGSSFVCLALLVFCVTALGLCAFHYWKAAALMHRKARDVQQQSQECEEQPKTLHPLREGTADVWIQTHLPLIWPKLVRPYSSSQLLLPLQELCAEVWSVDVFGFMGVPVLSASSRLLHDGCRVVEVFTRGDNRTILASVSSFLELRGINGAWLGRLEIGQDCRCLLRDAIGSPMLSISPGQDDLHTKIAVLPQGTQVATVTRSNASLVFPFEHLKVTAAPGVDVVFMLICTLARIAFAGHPCAFARDTKGV